MQKSTHFSVCGGRFHLSVAGLPCRFFTICTEKDSPMSVMPPSGRHFS